MPSLRRRSIEDRDLDAVAALLASGFPHRSGAWWRRGMERLRMRDCPPGYPRYGRLLASDDRLVGALLTIHASIPEADGNTMLRRNLSSWYVAPGFAAHAPLLLGAAARDTDITTINISPAAHTQPIIEAQGFRTFAKGSLATVPLLARWREAASTRAFAAADRSLWFDGALVADHIGFGCLCFVVDAADGGHPFVFAPPQRLSGLLPAAHLIYCRDIEDFLRFARPLGAALARRGVALAIVDGPDHLPGLPGRRFNLGQGKYAVGPRPPRWGDLAYSELAIFH